MDTTQQQTPIVTEESRRPGDRVRLISGFHKEDHEPEIRIGRVTETGVTIIARSTDSIRGTFHLEAEDIFGGEPVFRGDRYFELYTRERYRDIQRAQDSNPVGWSELPPPTHRPESDLEAVT